jgi:hypothetical protein
MKILTSILLSLLATGLFAQGPGYIAPGVQATYSNLNVAGTITASNIVMQAGTINGSTALNGTQVPTADWVRRKFGNGQFLYPTTNAIPTGFDGLTYTYSKTIPGFTSRSYTSITNNQYLGTVIDPFPAFSANGPDYVQVVCGIDTTNGASLDIVCETYWSYDKTNLFSECISTASRNVMMGTNTLLFAYPRPAEVFTNNGAHWTRRLKASNVVGDPTFTVYQGTNATITPANCSYSGVNIPMIDMGNVVAAHATLLCTGAQVNAGTTVSNVIPWQVVLDNYQIGVTNGAKGFTIKSPGAYFFSLSPIFFSGATEGVQASWWVRLNGVNVDGSGTPQVFPTVTGGGTLQNMTAIPSASFNLVLAQGDYVEILWWADAATVTMPRTAATAGPPARPACYPAILTINHVSAQ